MDLNLFVGVVNANIVRIAKYTHKVAVYIEDEVEDLEQEMRLLALQQWERGYFKDKGTVDISKVLYQIFRRYLHTVSIAHKQQQEVYGYDYSWGGSAAPADTVVRVWIDLQKILTADEFQVFKLKVEGFCPAEIMRRVGLTWGQYYNRVFPSMRRKVKEYYAVV